MEKIFADIIINISHEAVDRVFQYRVPVSLRATIQIGQQVMIPFGRGNHERSGYVVGFHDTVDFDEAKTKEIIRISEKSVPLESEMIKLAYWMKEQYGSTIYNALKTVLPVKAKVVQAEDRTIRLLLNEEETKLLVEQFPSNHVAKKRLMTELMYAKELSYQLVTKKLNVSGNTVQSLVKSGAVELVSNQRNRNPLTEKAFSKTDEKQQLNAQQQAIVSEFAQNQSQGMQMTYLLHGVTGSGKTVVYIELIEQILKQGRQAIVLIPEIALTYQTVKRFYERFGDQVSILNSRMSQGERYDQYMRAKNGEISIMIGPRSALFAPFSDIGLIIIDEEHEQTYKSETTPKYHARETAIQRARMHGASVVLGSATPSLESYTNARLGKYRLWKMTERAVEQAILPQVHVVDLREEMANGNRTMFSGKLRELIQDRLEKKQQIMLFINRRGYNNFVSCRSCGHVVKCPHCDVSMTIHNNGTLVCHYCGHTRQLPRTCPKCHSPHIAGFGVGTQKVVSAVQKEFPEARVLRMDMDTTKGKHGHETILQQFSNQEADILVGTQMIVKGHDFSNVTLVGIIAADLSLHSSDYRAGERTFQLLTQAAGRAGRGNLPGDVVIQTYSPDHYSIVTAAEQNYEDFYEQEIVYRRILKYPPVYHLMVILLTGTEESKVIYGAELLHKQIGEKERQTVIGPNEASISKINDRYRRVIYIKALEIEQLIDTKDTLERYMEQSPLYNELNVQFDFDPMSNY
jgi:primosomal protein N' (replication factor Y)